MADQTAGSFQTPDTPTRPEEGSNADESPRDTNSLPEQEDDPASPLPFGDDKEENEDEGTRFGSLNDADDPRIPQYQYLFDRGLINLDPFLDNDNDSGTLRRTRSGWPKKPRSATPRRPEYRGPSPLQTRRGFYNADNEAEFSGRVFPTAIVVTSPVLSPVPNSNGAPEWVREWDQEYEGLEGSVRGVEAGPSAAAGLNTGTASVSGRITLAEMRWDDEDEDSRSELAEAIEKERALERANAGPRAEESSASRCRNRRIAGSAGHEASAYDRASANSAKSPENGLMAGATLVPESATTRPDMSWNSEDETNTVSTAGPSQSRDNFIHEDDLEDELEDFTNRPDAYFRFFLSHITEASLPQLSPYVNESNGVSEQIMAGNITMRKKLDNARTHQNALQEDVERLHTERDSLAAEKDDCSNEKPQHNDSLAKSQTYFQDLKASAAKLGPLCNIEAHTQAQKEVEALKAQLAACFKKEKINQEQIELSREENTELKARLASYTKITHETAIPDSVLVSDEAKASIAETDSVAAVNLDTGNHNPLGNAVAMADSMRARMTKIRNLPAMQKRDHVVEAERRRVRDEKRWEEAQELQKLMERMKKLATEALPAAR